uniref:Uncharacterized protein n=1 Tax=Rhizophora mucronata TaxID=61149 RepID=A0A2P2K8K1_RHIMU
MSGASMDEIMEIMTRGMRKKSRKSKVCLWVAYILIPVCLITLNFLC